MSDMPTLTTVPRDLYYHEVAYVRRLEADNERLRAALKQIVEQHDPEFDGHSSAIDMARRALEQGK